MIEMVRTGIQLHTLDALDEPFPEKGNRIAQADFEGVEFAGVEDLTAEEIVTVLERFELEPIAAHTDVEKLETEYDAVTDIYRTIGCSDIVVSWDDSDALDTLDGIRQAANRVSELAEALADDGFSLSYHNDRFEFQEVEGRTAFDRFVEALDTRVGLEIDTGLARHAGQNPSQLIEQYADRTTIVQLTDARTGSETTFHVELHAGEVDLEACVEASREAGVEWLIYEHRRTTDPVASLEHGGLLLGKLATRRPVG